MLTSKIANPGVVINELRPFPADITPIAAAMPPFLDSAPNAQASNAPVVVTSLKDSTDTSAAASGEGSILSSEEVDQQNSSPPSK
ncbi:MAG TPA: hypothetical protein VGF69_03925 [Thermoanaerobaculia bacterium]|jgi:hypothetical protein